MEEQKEEQKQQNNDDLYTNSIFESLQPPPKAYLMFPKEETQYVQTKNKKKFERQIYGGQIQFIQMEEEKLNSLKEYLKNQKEVEILNQWPDSELLRFHCANDFDNKKTHQNIKINIEFRLKNLPYKLDSDIQKILNDGVIYFYGRDNRYRPIVHFNFSKFDLQKYGLMFLRTLTFVSLEITMNNFFLPGQIEQIVFIEDYSNMKLFNLPYKAMKDFEKLFNDNYKSRMYKCYVVNVPTAFWWLWKIAKMMLDEITLSKVVMVKGNTTEEMFKHINRKQVQQRYGGDAPNIDDHFWPPQMNNSDILLDSEKEEEVLMTTEEYKQLYISGKLANNKVFKDYLK